MLGKSPRLTFFDSLGIALRRFDFGDPAHDFAEFAAYQRPGVLQELMTAQALAQRDFGRTVNPARFLGPSLAVGISAPAESVGAATSAKRPRPSVVKPDAAVRTPPAKLAWTGRASVAPHLWEDRAKRANMRSILIGITEFLKRRGYWPTKRELANKMKTTPLAVDWYCAANQDAGTLVLHGGKWKERRRIELTQRGWASIKREPITPFRNPPGGSMRKKIANAIARDVEKLLGEAQVDT